MEIKGNNNGEILKNYAQSLVDEYVANFSSIKRYGGFYIGRYELTGTIEEPTVKRGEYVLTAETANTWYGLKKACSEVVSGEDKSVQSMMIYGNEWDEVMDWLKSTRFKQEPEKVDKDSSSWGNYSNSTGDAAIEGAGEPQVAGYSDSWSANNIYDLAGNYYDYTQEANTATWRSCRGRILWCYRTSIRSKC